MTAYRCDECDWVGRELDTHRVMDHVDDEPPVSVVIQSCPDCGGEELTEITLCIACLVEGIDNEATHDDYCIEHAKQNFEPEDMEKFKRDQVQSVKPLVKP